MPTFDLEKFLPYQFALLASRTSREFENIYAKKYGISQAEWRLIAHLGQEDKVSIREIYKRVDMDKSKVSRAATRLESGGYVHKETNAADKRLIELSLTRKGRNMLAQIGEMARSYDEDLRTRLSVDDREALEKGLDAIIATLVRNDS